MNAFRNYLLLTLVLLGGRASAQLVDIPLSSIGLAVPNATAATLHIGSSERRGLVTPFTISGLPYSTSLVWFCIDPLDAMYYPGNQPSRGDSDITYTNTGSTPVSFDRWASGFGPATQQNRLYQLESLFNQNLYATNPNLSAIQMVVWEIMNEKEGNALNLTNGEFWITQSNTAVLNAATTMLNSINYSLSNSRDPMFLIDGRYDRDITSGGGIVLVQDLVGFVPIPEPSHFALFGALSLGALIVRRRSLVRNR